MNAQILLQTLNAIQALLVWLAGRGVTRDKVQQMLNAAHDEQRDFTTAEVQALLDETGAELDDTQRLIDGGT